MRRRPSGEGHPAGDADRLAGDVAALVGRRDHMRRASSGGVCAPESPTFSGGIAAGISGVHTGSGATVLT